MENVVPRRRPFWRFSIRELLLLTLTIGAFLGWGRTVYQRYKPFVPTPFLTKLDLSGDVVLIRQQLGEPTARWSSSSGGGSGGPRGYERNYRLGFPLESAKRTAFVEKFQQRIRDQLDAHGCRIHGNGRGRSGDMEEFRLRYVRDVVEGSVRVILVPSGDDARLLVFIEERRLTQ